MIKRYHQLLLCKGDKLMTHEKQNDRLKEIFESTVESGIKYDGSYESIKYYNLFCKAASQEKFITHLILYSRKR